MDASDQKRQLIGDQTEGTGHLRNGVETVRAGVDRAWLVVEDAGWFLREHLVWPVEDSFDRLGRRGAIGVFGGGGIAVAGVVAALALGGSGGSGSSAGTTEAFITPQRSPTPAPAVVVPAPKPKKVAPKPTGPTLHGAPPDFAPAKNVQSGVGDGKAVSKEPRKAKAPSQEETAPPPRVATTSADDAPASTAKIGATPEATASAQAQASSLATASGADIAETSTGTEANGGTAKGAEELTGPPAPKAAKKVARRFAEAFVSYEVGGIDTKVRKTFGLTSTKQLSRSLLHRPPRQPASVKVPKAKVVNVVAGPSKGNVYTVSVSLLRVGVTSELRLEMEQGVGKKWQVINVLG